MVFTFHNEMAIDNLLEQLHFGHISKLVAKHRTLLLDSFTFQIFFFCMKKINLSSSTETIESKFFFIYYSVPKYCLYIQKPFDLIP